MPKTYSIDGEEIRYYLFGEPGSGTESLVSDFDPVFQDYNKIIESLKPGEIFEDPYFKAVKKSIAFNPDEEDNEIENLDGITWLRPHEILTEKNIDEEPLFVDNGGDLDKVGDKNDVNQNQLGDCWFLCSMAEISRLPDIFWLVVCKENLTQFNKNEYHGIFKFRFAAFGRLIEIVVDDRIPFMQKSRVHWSVESDNPRVFWSALLEKAYAKLNSSYQAIQGGYIGDALQDFTGGVIDRYDDIGEMDKNKLWKIITENQNAGFYMGVSIMKKFKNDDDKDDWEAKTDLVNYHAYSLLTVKEVNIKKKKYRLLRIRNPWGGAHEYKAGKFCEKRGKLYKKLDEETQKEFPAAEDGEFWMDLDEFVENFTLLEIVSLNPFGSQGKNLEQLCEEVDFGRILKDSEWNEDNCCGGLGPDPESDDAEEEEEKDESNEEEEDEGDTEEDDDEENDDDNEGEEEETPEVELTEDDYIKFCGNPQIQFSVPEIKLDKDGKSEVVISLLQRYRRNMKQVGEGNAYIGMCLAKVLDKYPINGREILAGKTEFFDLDGGYQRSHTVRIKLTPGKWVVIPYNRNQLFAEFTVIVYYRK